MDDSTADSTPWQQPGWPEEARRWIQATLARHGLRLTGAITQPHVRAWSTVLRVPSSEGDLFFKAVLPRLGFETRLTAALSSWRPDVTPRLLAVDHARGWMLMAGDAPRLREVIRTGRDLSHWERILPDYAELQMSMAAYVGELLALGTPDRRLAGLPAAYAALLADAEALQDGRPDGLSAAEQAQLRGLAPRFAEHCARLAGYPFAESLNHGDFHDGNILLRGGGYVYFDWGDACVGHPFFSYRTVCVSVEISLDLPENPPECERLRDVYLEPWTRYAPRPQVEAAFALAYPLGVVNGALAWQRALAGLPEAERAGSAHAVPALLREFMGLMGDAPRS